MMRRDVLILGLLIAMMAALALGPKAPPLGTPVRAADIERSADPALPRPVIYQPCRTMVWLARTGLCEASGEAPH